MQYPTFLKIDTTAYDSTYMSDITTRGIVLDLDALMTYTGAGSIMEALYTVGEGIIYNTFGNFKVNSFMECRVHNSIPPTGETQQQFAFGFYSNVYLQKTDSTIYNQGDYTTIESIPLFTISMYMRFQSPYEPYNFNEFGGTAILGAVTEEDWAEENGRTIVDGDLIRLELTDTTISLFINGALQQRKEIIKDFKTLGCLNKLRGVVGVLPSTKITDLRWGPLNVLDNQLLLF